VIRCAAFWRTLPSREIANGGVGRDCAAQGMSRQVRNLIAVLTDNRRLPLFGDILKNIERE